jgi:hypothetical protein
MTMSRRFSIILGALAVVAMLGIVPAAAEQESTATPRPAAGTATAKAEKKSTELAERNKNATATAEKKSATLAEKAKTAKTERTANRTDFDTARKAKSLAKLQAAGAKAIDQRTAAINEFVADMADNACVSAGSSAKTAVTTGLAASKKNLESQKTALAAATTYDAAKTIVQAIFTDNRVFAHLLPAAKGLCRADGALTLLTDKITKAIATLKADGKDTATLEAQLAEAKIAIKAAEALYESVLKTPGGTGAKADLESAIKNTKSAREALATISSELKKLLATLASTD